MNPILNDFFLEIDRATSAIGLYRSEINLYDKSKILVEPPAVLTLPSELELAKWVELQKTSYNDKKILMYYNVIIIIYGALEQFIERSSESFLKRINLSTERFNLLPVKIQENHIRFSVSLADKTLNRPDLNRTPVKDLIGNLWGCLDNTKKYVLNADAFTSQIKSNYNMQQIYSLATYLGITGANLIIANNQNIVSLYPGDNQTQIEANLKTELEDLAQRRNEVSHGGIVSNILDDKILEEKIMILKELATAWDSTLDLYYMQCVSSNTGQSFNTPIAIHADQIVCFELENVFLRVGDYLIADTNNPKLPLLVSPILDIQINKKSYKNIKITSKSQVAFKVSFKARKPYKYSYLNKKFIN